MEDSGWLRVVTIGLVLAAFAVGYLLISGRFSPFKTITPSETAVVETPQPTSTPQILGNQTPPVATTPSSAYSRIVERTQGSTQVLPNTGFPAFTFGLLSAAAMIVGFGLRRFSR